MMNKPNEYFTPGQVDEQIAHLLRSQPDTLPTAHFVQEVHRHYQEERQTLEGAWERLSTVLDGREHSEIEQVNALETSSSQAIPAGEERVRQRRQPTPGKAGIMRRLVPFAAVLLTVLLISAFALTFSLMHRAKTGTNPNGPIPPIGVPSSASATSVKTGVVLTSGLRLHMVTQSVGWAIGSSANNYNWASVLRTTDGGLHWKQVTPSQAASQGISYLYILDETTAWLPGQGGTWYRTTDGGVSWKSLHWLSGEIRPFSFSDQNHGWMIVSSSSGDKSHPPSTPSAQPKNLLYTTSDGGDSWQPTTTFSFPLIREYITINAQTGWLTTEDVTGNSSVNFQTRLYVTHDAGHTWEQRQLPRPAGITKQVPSLTFGPTFVTENDGSLFAAFGQDATHDMYLYVTHDGGKSWQVQGSAIPGYLGVRSVVDDQHILVDSITANGGIQMDLLTLINGQWRQQGAHPTKGDPVEYSFPSPSTGIALVSTRSNSLDVYRTHDAGKIWQKIATLPAV
jgi:photosystem II stability/assembly factor-like uncharacterized protein